MAKEDMPEWFTDLSEVQVWIILLAIYCIDDVHDTIKLIAGKFNATISILMGSNINLATDHPPEVEKNLSARVMMANEGVLLDCSLGTLAENVSFTHLKILNGAQKELGKHIG